MQIVAFEVLQLVFHTRAKKLKVSSAYIMKICDFLKQMTFTSESRTNSHVNWIVSHNSTKECVTSTKQESEQTKKKENKASIIKNFSLLLRNHQGYLVKVLLLLLLALKLL